MNKKQKDRYILYQGELKIGEASSIEGIGKLIGCSKQHIYGSYTKENRDTFSFLRKDYKITDKLDLI